MPSQKEILQLEYDKKQTQFAIDGTLIINQKVIDEQTPLTALINENNFYICPFCLNNSNKFTIESHALIKCPTCSNFMKMKTLLFVKDCSNEEYAKWVFDYRLSGFFKKINFEQWTKKMIELGMSYEFWEKYKSLKGDYERAEKEDLEKEESDSGYTKEQQQNIVINALKDKINEGLTKEQILNDLVKNNIEFKIEFFDYCFNEAELKIKKEGLNYE